MEWRLLLSLHAAITLVFVAESSDGGLSEDGLLGADTGINSGLGSEGSSSVFEVCVRAIGEPGLTALQADVTATFTFDGKGSK